MRSRLPLAFVAVAIALVAPRSADACSTLPGGLFERRALPPAGAVEVPTNTRAVIHYRAIGPMSESWLGGLGEDLEMRAKDGAAVPVTTQKVATGSDYGQWEVVVVLTPTAPLAPNTPYELLDRRGRLSCSRPCVPGDPAVFASFTTGMDRDDVAPQIPGQGSLLAQEIRTCDSTSCCGPYRIKQYEAHWPAATDDVASSRTLYNFYRAGQPTPLMVLLEVTQLALTVACDSRGASGRWLIEPGNYTVRPVDWSGNEGPAVDLGTIPTSCDPPDTSLGAPTDAAGCDCGVGGANRQASPPTALLPFALIVAGFHIRRLRR
jgi:hypothetical protein